MYTFELCKVDDTCIQVTINISLLLFYYIWLWYFCFFDTRHWVGFPVAWGFYFQHFSPWLGKFWNLHIGLGCIFVMLHLNLIPPEFFVGSNLCDVGLLSILTCILHPSNNKAYLSWVSLVDLLTYIMEPI